MKKAVVNNLLSILTIKLDCNCFYLNDLLQRICSFFFFKLIITTVNNLRTTRQIRAGPYKYKSMIIKPKLPYQNFMLNMIFGYYSERVVNNHFIPSAIPSPFKAEQA